MFFFLLRWLILIIFLGILWVFSAPLFFHWSFRAIEPWWICIKYYEIFTRKQWIESPLSIAESIWRNIAFSVSSRSWGFPHYLMVSDIVLPPSSFVLICTGNDSRRNHMRVNDIFVSVKHRLVFLFMSGVLWSGDVNKQVFQPEISSLSGDFRTALSRLYADRIWRDHRGRIVQKEAAQNWGLQPPLREFLLPLVNPVNPAIYRKLQSFYHRWQRRKKYVAA